jgi:hypothetical protein
VSARNFSMETPRSAKVAQVIVVEAVRGNGMVDGDPIRIVTQYWSFDGELLAEHDPVKPSSDE